VEEPASHRRVTPMVLNCGGFFVYLQDMIEAAHPIQNNEIKYCVMCLALHGEWTPSSCDVYSMDRGHHIPCCCDCCHEVHAKYTAKITCNPCKLQLKDHETRIIKPSITPGLATNESEMFE
jgi:hypothetical protein